MIRRLLLLTSLTLTLSVWASSLQANEALKCSLNAIGEHQLKKASPRIEDLLDRIVTIGKVSQKYTICATPNIENAYATIHWDEKKRIIAYDPVFLDKWAKESGDYHWGTVTVLAHEVGHHVLKHILKYTSEPTDAQSRQDELEADKFAGLVLGHLGASLANAQALMKTMNTNIDDSTHTHPSGEKRVAAIKQGWIEACIALGNECNDASMKSASKSKSKPVPTDSLAITQGYNELVKWSSQLKGKKVTDEYCEKYAAVSVEQAKLAKKAKCGFNIDTSTDINQWSENETAQRDWCKKASAYATEKEVKYREKKLSQCTTLRQK